MKKLNGILYVTTEELAAAGLPSRTISAGIRRGGAWQSQSDPADARQTLVAYEPLPVKYKEMLKSQYNDLYQLVGQQEAHPHWADGERLAQGLRISNAEHAALLRHLPAEDALEHARACAWLALLANNRRSSDLDALGVASKRELYDIVLYRLQMEQLKPLRLSNLRVLQKRVAQYKKAGHASILHGNKGNDNAAKIKQQEQEKLLLALMSSPAKPDYVTVAYLYNKQAEKKSWPMIDSKTAARYLDAPKVKRVWWAARHGEDAYYQQYDLTILRQRPTRANALWVLDGTPLDLYFYKKQEKWNPKTQKWQERSTYYNRMDMILVADAATWKIVGAVLCEHENADAVREALKQGVQAEMKLPAQLTYDQGSGMAAQKWMIEQLNIYNTPTRPYSAKAKVIENIIGHFQNKILRYYESWSGMNIRTRKLDSHSNPDHLHEVRDKLPTLEQLQEQFQEAVRVWNELPTKTRKAPNVAYRTLDDAGRSLDILEYVELFWEKRKHEYPYRTDGIRLQVRGQEHVFQATGAATVQRLLGGKYEVALDPDCLEYIYLYQDGKMVLDEAAEPLVLLAASRVPMAIDDYQEGDAKRIKKLIALKDEVKAADMAAAAEIKKYAAEEGIELGARYVYKDRLNDAEAAFKRRELKESETDWGQVLESKYLDE